MATLTPAASAIHDLATTCVSHRLVGPGLYRLDVQLDEALAQPFGQPGQFVMLALPGTDFRFRRPFSLADFDPVTRWATIYYKVMGQGTQRLTTVRPGDRVSLLGPLGNPFAPVPSVARTLLVAGGVGLPPLLWWAIDQRRADHPAPTVIYGVRTTEELTDFSPWLEDWLGPDHYWVSTDDGSYGYHGNVVTALMDQKDLILETVDDVLLCGPNPMMAAVVRWFGGHHSAARVQVSLENHMPCGTGACFGCVVAPSAENERASGQPLRVCLAGPVFDARDLAWGPRGPVTDCFDSQSCPA